MRPSRSALGLFSWQHSLGGGGEGCLKEAVVPVRGEVMKVWSSLVAVGQEVGMMERQLQLRVGSERQGRI